LKLHAIPALPFFQAVFPASSFQASPIFPPAIDPPSPLNQIFSDPILSFFLRVPFLLFRKLDNQQKIPTSVPPTCLGDELPPLRLFLFLSFRSPQYVSLVPQCDLLFSPLLEVLFHFFFSLLRMSFFPLVISWLPKRSVDRSKTSRRLFPRSSPTVSPPPNVGNVI